MKIFLDDIRDPQNCVSYMHSRIGKNNPLYLEGWWVVRNFEDFKKAVEAAFSSGIKISHISFDHDLSDEHYLLCDAEFTNWDEYYADDNRAKTGYDCAKWFIEYCRERDLKRPVIFVHSMNPVGTQNIINLFKN